MTSAKITHYKKKPAIEQKKEEEDINGILTLFPPKALQGSFYILYRYYICRPFLQFLAVLSEGRSLSSFLP